MTRSTTEFTILKAYHGDSILIKTFDSNLKEFVILIDGGTSQTFKYFLKKELQNLDCINLLVLTHIDSDHISGLINLFKSSLIKKIQIDEIWMNHPDLIIADHGTNISVNQGDTFKNLINTVKPETKITSISTLDGKCKRSGLEFNILSPTPEIITKLYKFWGEIELPKKQNKSNISSSQVSYNSSLKELSKTPYKPSSSIFDDIFNSSSISFILNCPDVKLLLLADSRPEIISQSLKKLGFSNEYPLKMDYVKVSHHGSLNNTSQELLSLISCNNYIISTNGGSANHMHPSRETLSRIVYNSNRNAENLNIFFNYEIDVLKTRIGEFINDNDMNSGNWSAISRNEFKN